MTILGKVLAFFNVLLAATFVYFAALDWGKRHTWQYSVFRHELVLNGLPMDDQVIDPILGERQVDRITDSTAQKMFLPVGGMPVKTQQEEVTRVRDAIKAELNGLDDSARRARLRQIFLDLSRSSLDRYHVLERVDGFDEKTGAPLASTEQLMKDFDSLFTDLTAYEIDIASSNPPARQLAPLAKQLLPKDKQAAVTHLLFTLTPNPDRVQVVVGIKSLVDEIQSQADVLDTMAAQQEFALLGDRADFEIQYKRKLARIQNLAASLQDRQFVRASHERLKTQHDGLLQERIDTVKAVEMKLDTSRIELRKLLKAQAEEELNLFKAHQVLSTIRSENERLELEIRRLEKVK